MIESERWLLTPGRASRTTMETRSSLSSLSPQASTLLHAARSWGIEHVMHWVLDIAFREDESRVRQGHAAQNLVLLRRRALHQLRRDTSVRLGMAAKRCQAGRNLAYLDPVLAP